ncbi:RND family transporter [Egicoccus sp. AB-alg2]|uniref:efflux RND transporter permease subunit n=1 Tax=Egicoccus sp. AB-alg2 TaxID=3242693 RepID=UPI00359E0F00
MSRLLDLLARVAIRVPALTLAGLLVATVVLGAAASSLEVDTGVESFAPEGGAAATLESIEQRFGTVSSVQLLVDAGAQGNVLGRTGLQAAQRLEDTLAADPTIAAALVPSRPDQPAVITYGYPFLAGLDAAESDLEDLDDTTLQILVDGVVDRAGEQVEPLLSDDLETEPARARSGLVQIELDSAAPSAVRADASRAIESVAAETDTGDLRISILSMTAIEDGIERALNRDMPVLLGTSLLLVLGVLAWLFRSVSDVVVGFFGLIASIVWMAGFGAVLGPDGLGLIGPMSQIAIAVPVLLVGLGIDYSVHLTSRYREQRALGDVPDTAARTALRTVGVALVLATIASVAGFLANVATPLPPIRDFGVLAAVGIVSAFLILGAAVPATRVLLDRRRDAHGAAAHTGKAAERVTGGDPRWVQVATALATRHVVPVLGVTAFLLLVGGVAATGLSTEFDDRDFLPEGDPVIAVLDRLDAQFGGDVGERTYVLVDGDPRDPALLTAVAAYEDDLAGIEDVRRVGERAEVVSPFRLVDRLGEQASGVRERIAGELDDWLDPQAAAERIDLPDTIDPELVEEQADGSVDVPRELLDALRPRLPEGRDPTVALAATADQDDLRAQVREALAQDIADDRPEVLDDAALRSLAALDDSELTLAVLRDAGYPLDRLDEDERRQLELLEALEAAGWQEPDDADAAVPDGTALRDQLDVVAAYEGDELARFLDDDGLVLTVSTAGGSERAEALAVTLHDAADPVEAAGGEVTVVSDPLVQAEIISSLSAAQLLAILISLVAAAVLLVTATLLSSRSVVLGLIGIVPSTIALVLVLGVMYPLGLAFNALTATVASIAVGIGVPYGIHLINRFREAREHGLSPDDAVADSLRNTGAALVGSAVTTGLAFAVLMLFESTPISQFGAVSTMMIAFAVLACLLVQPALLVLWGRHRARRDERRTSAEPADDRAPAGMA